MIVTAVAPARQGSLHRFGSINSLFLWIEFSLLTPLCFCLLRSPNPATRNIVSNAPPPRGRHAYRSMILSPFCCRVDDLLWWRGPSQTRPDNTRPRVGFMNVSMPSFNPSFIHSFIPYMILLFGALHRRAAPGLTYPLFELEKVGPRLGFGLGHARATGARFGRFLVPQTHEAQSICALHLDTNSPGIKATKKTK